MDLNKTQEFNFGLSREDYIKSIVDEVYSALEEKGYDPVIQMVGYILSGDPTFITAHKNARSLIMKVERDEIMEFLVRFYVKKQ